MSVGVVTIAFTDGAHAETIAREVATRLNFRYLNNEILDLAAKEAGVEADQVASVEKSESLIARIVRSLGSVPSPEMGISPLAAMPDERPEYRAIIQEVVKRVAAEGKVVIGAHGAGISLAGTPGLLRVFLTAPVETRVARLREEKGLDEKTARHEVEHTDRERKNYFDRFFRIQEQPSLYDMVLSTGTLSDAQAVSAVLAAAG
ncbi:MAG: AAA family ATPase [Dehalococcoidia bacterium]